MSCSTKYAFVVLRDIPQKPSIVVIPASDYLYQVEFANTLESYVIRSGVKVVTRPITKEVETTKQLGGTKVESQQAVAAEAQQKERYFAYEEIEADYCLFSYADSRQIKIVKRATREVLTAFTLRESQTQSAEQIVYDALKSVGIPVREVLPGDNTTRVKSGW
jgi:hypothetical protein